MPLEEDEWLRQTVIEHTKPSPESGYIPPTMPTTTKGHALPAIVERRHCDGEAEYGLADEPVIRHRLEPVEVYDPRVVREQVEGKMREQASRKHPNADECALAPRDTNISREPCAIM